MGEVGLRPIAPPRSLAEDAADRIREEILSGGFAQGEHLVEAKIAERLNVSRGPVREAFKLLRSEGLLQEEPRRGTFVVRLLPADIREIYGVRAAIEGRAARSIAERRDTVAASELRERLAAIEDAVRRGEPTAVFRRDLEFHDALCRLSGNARLHEVFTRYVPTLRALLRLDEHVYRSLDDIAMEHRPLLDAIERGDAARAAELAEHHCDHAGELIAGLIDARPSGAAAP
ncbi:MAG TPA: GntR family transcriptional regulator [Actinomycetota bacterium]|nr:GntR family transcriptional regulator [Actinomycetota bacterium]